MKRTRFFLLPTLAILILLIGLLGLVGEHLGRARAAGPSVTNCDDSGSGSLRDTIASAPSGSTITFSLSCDIKLNSTLTISTDKLTLDGEGQQVTLDGQNTVLVLRVSSGVTFTLNALTIANGKGGIDGGLSKLTITNSTIANNTADGLGGGIQSHEGLTIINSTIANNTVVGPGSDGGGIFFKGNMLTITNSTIANNTASAGGGIALQICVGCESTFIGNIVANNTGGNCFRNPPTDKGYNLSNDTSCNFTASTSLQNTDPKLDPNGLQNNGGPTQTIALEPDSPAVDKIPVGSSCPATDQRGVTRPQGPACDIGAFELSAADRLNAMINLVNSFNLPKGLQTSLDAKLQAALASVNRGNTSAACGQMGAFINEMQAQSGKGLTLDQANQLQDDATQIQTTLGC